jgi:hypothetical protein
MGASEHGEEAKVKKSEREILIVGKLPAAVVAEIEAAEYGVPTPPTGAPKDIDAAQQRRPEQTTC